MYGQNSPPLGEYFLVPKEVSFSRSRENFNCLFRVNFLQFQFYSNPVFTRPPISLCLSIIFLPNRSFFDPPTQTLCEEILCSI